jgi:hypothetical protein
VEAIDVAAIDEVGRSIIDEVSHRSTSHLAAAEIDGVADATPPS